MNKKASRKVVADMILKSEEGIDMLVYDFPLDEPDPAHFSFKIIDPETGDQFKVTVTSDEI